MRKHRLYGIALALLFVVGLLFSHASGATTPAAYAAPKPTTTATPVVVALADDPSSVNANPEAEMSGQTAVEYHALVLQYQKVAQFAAAVNAYQAQQALEAQQRAAAAAAAELREQEAAQLAAQREAQAQEAATLADESTSGGPWLALRRCESGDNYAEDTGNGYYGAYQFALGTWEGLGYSGLPSSAPPAVQDEAARRLQARSGWGQWPACSRRLGLT